MPALVISSRAETEMAEAALWHEEQRAGLGGEFLAAADEALRKITESPQLFRRVRRSPDVRRVLLGKFPWHVWFCLDRDSVRVFAVLHARRDPREWRSQVVRDESKG